MIKTNRLHIQHLCADDWRKMKEIFSDFSQSKYAKYDAPLPTEDSEVQELIKKIADSHFFP